MLGPSLRMRKKLEYPPWAATIPLKQRKNTECPPNHMTFVPAKFEVATSNSLGEDAFTRKYII